MNEYKINLKQKLHHVHEEIFFGEYELEFTVKIYSNLSMLSMGRGLASQKPWA